MLLGNVGLSENQSVAVWIIMARGYIKSSSRSRQNVNDTRAGDYKRSNNIKKGNKRLNKELQMLISYLVLGHVTWMR